MKKKILYISGTRADYGLMKTVLLAIKESAELELEIVATGMHLMEEFGNTFREIKKDGFKIHVIQAIFEKDNKKSMANFIGKLIYLLSEDINKIIPDIILVMGDRGEMLAGAVVGAYFRIPVVHIHGGEISSTIDDSVRNAITKLADFHLPATKKSADRIIKMGEDKNRVIVVGAPGLEEKINSKLLVAKTAKKYGIDNQKPFLIVVQHPVSEEIKLASSQIKETLLAIEELGHQSIIIYPNADAGGRAMIKIIERYRKVPFLKIFKNIPHDDFLNLMKMASVLVGNSSAGMIETASFNLPTINIGIRQKGRERGNNVFDVGHDKIEIKKAIEKAIKIKKKEYKNPYFTKGTDKKIVEVLKKI